MINTTIINKANLEEIVFKNTSPENAIKSVSTEVDFKIRIRTLRTLSNVSIRLKINQESSVYFDNEPKHKEKAKFRTIGDASDGKEITIGVKFISALKIDDLEHLLYTTRIYLKHNDNPVYTLYNDENDAPCRVTTNPIK